jgi:predicted nucleic acid-binding protein
MIQAVFLDAGPLGLVNGNPRDPEVLACVQWTAGLHRAGVALYVPEIADCEVRRELLRAGKKVGLARLDAFLAARSDRLVVLTTPTMRRAAELWAETRNKGYPTAHPMALDGDVLVAAAALTFGLPTGTYTVATDNTKHLTRYVDADEWRNIQP